MGAHVNLIPVNKVNETGYKRGKRESVEAFAKLLNDNGQNATIRRELGSDINAACGHCLCGGNSVFGVVQNNNRDNDGVCESFHYSHLKFLLNYVAEGA